MLSALRRIGRGGLEILSKLGLAFALIARAIQFSRLSHVDVSLLFVARKRRESQSRICIFVYIDTFFARIDF